MSPRVLTLVRSVPGPSPATEILGTVAEAVVFTDGTAILHWLTAGGSTEFYPSEAAMREIRERSGRSAFAEARLDPAALPDDLGYHLYVAKDPKGASSPDGTGDRTATAATLSEAVGYLIAAARDGVEYVCLEILKDRPAYNGPQDVTVKGGKL